jgi:outer membrane protein TolC
MSFSSRGVGCGRNRAWLMLVGWLCCVVVRADPEPPPEVVTADLVRRLSDRMRERHLELRGLIHASKAEHLNAEGTRRWADPDVMLGGGLYRYAEMARENGDLFYGVEQKLPLMGKEKAARALAESNAVAAGVRVEARFAELRRDLAVRLFTAAEARAEAALIAADVAWLEAQVRLGRTRVASGTEPAAMVLRLENELDRRRLEWTNAVARRRDAEAAVEFQVSRTGVSSGGISTRPLVGGGSGAAKSSSPGERLRTGDEDVATPFRVAIGEIPVEGPSGDWELATGISQSYALPPVADAVPFGPVLVRFAERAEPEVLRREREIGVASAAVQVTRRSQRPDFAVGVQSYHESATGTAAQGMLTVTMSVPWFNRANYRRDLERERARLASAEAQVEDARVLVRREVHRLVTQIDAGRREALLMRDVVLPRTRRLQESLEGLWTSGRAELRDLLEVRRQRIEAEMAEVRATAEYWMAVSELLLCCGLEDLETVRELVGGSVTEGGIKR